MLSKETLEKFVKFRQSQNEIKNRLEQLRALDNNIKINVALAKSSPIGVDTEEDYLALKKIMEYKVLMSKNLFSRYIWSIFSFSSSYQLIQKQRYSLQNF